MTVNYNLSDTWIGVEKRGTFVRRWRFETGGRLDTNLLPEDFDSGEYSNKGNINI